MGIVYLTKHAGVLVLISSYTGGLKDIVKTLSAWTDELLREIVTESSLGKG